MSKDKYKAIRSIRDVRNERHRLEVQLRLSSQQLKIRKLEIENQLHLDRIVYAFFKKGFDSFMKRFHESVSPAEGEKE